MTKQPKHIPNPNTIGRPPGSRNKRTIIREAMQKAYPEGEAGFWAAVVEQAKAGDLQAATMLADRLYPKLKPQGELLTLSEPLDGSPAEQARTIVRLAGAGELSTDQARDLLAALADVCKIVEATELEQRLSQLEQLQGMKK